MAKHSKPTGSSSTSSGKDSKFVPDHNPPSHEDIAKGDTKSAYLGSPERRATGRGTDYPTREH